MPCCNKHGFNCPPSDAAARPRSPAKPRAQDLQHGLEPLADCGVAPHTSSLPADTSPGRARGSKGAPPRIPCQKARAGPLPSSRFAPPPSSAETRGLPRLRFGWQSPSGICQAARAFKTRRNSGLECPPLTSVVPRSVRPSSCPRMPETVMQFLCLCSDSLRKSAWYFTPAASKAAVCSSSANL